MSEPRKKILLVDTDRELVAANRKLLEGAGYEVYAAYDTAGGIEEARAKKADLIILDTILDSPEDGFELCRQVRADDSLKGTHLLVLSAVSEKFQMAFEPDSMWLPADRVLEKPIEDEKLLAEVSGIIG